MANVPVSELPRGVPIQELTHKVIQIQSLWRGYRVRSRLILPKELQPFLESDLEGIKCPKELRSVSKIIARHFVEMFRYPEDYKDEGVRLQKNECEYVDGDNGIHVLPKTLWMQLDDDDQSVRTQFYGELYRRGGHKETKESETLIVALRGGAQKRKRVEPTLLVRSLDGICNSDRRVATADDIREWAAENADDMKQSFEVIRELFSADEIANDPNLRLAGIPHIIRTYEGAKRQKLEWEDTRFPGDLADVIKTGSVKVDIAGNHVVPFRTNDKCRIVESLLYTVGKFHAKGKVHRDAKPQNVLMSYDPVTERPEGDLIDFDFVSDFTYDDNASDVQYDYWDSCAELGCVLPTVDIFGVAMCLGCSVFGNIFVHRLATKRKSGSLADIEKVIKACFFERMSSEAGILFQALGGTEAQNKAVEAFADSVAGSGGPTPQCFEEFRGALREMVKAEPSWAPVVREFFADCRAARDIAQLLGELYKADGDLLRFVQSDPGRTICRVIFDPDVPLEEKHKKIDEIYTIFSIFRNFGDRVKGIREVWERSVQVPKLDS